MEHDIQKASLWKRIAAGILDLILIMVLATGFGWAISAVSDYDHYLSAYKAEYQACADKYEIKLDMSAEEFERMPEPEQQAYGERAKQAYAEISQNQKANYYYGMVINLGLLIVVGGVLLAMLLLEWLVPLLLKNGQTVGKKVFAICVVRNDGVALNGVQHFTRTILGKYAVETMIPLYVGVMMLLGIHNGVLILFAAALLIAQLVIVTVTRNNCLLHDLMAGTVVVDYSTQKIFKSTEDLIAYQKRIAAERAARQTY